MDANNNYNTDSDQLTTESPIKGAFSAKNELRTLFVSGLPHDIKPREFNLLFHQMDGYEGAMIKHPTTPLMPMPGSKSPSGHSNGQSPNQQRGGGGRCPPQLGVGPHGNVGVIGPNGQVQGPVAFLTFASRKDAEAVKEKFQGFHVDPETTNTTMKLEFAKSNTKSRHRSREGQTNNQSGPFFNDQMMKTLPLSTIQQQQFATPVAIDPSSFMQSTAADIYGRNMCWPMCWPMYPEQLQSTTNAYHGATAQDTQFSPIHMETALQPILFPADQYEHHGRIGRSLSG